MSSSNPLTFSMTGSNISFQKKPFPREEPSSTSKKILSNLIDGFLDLKRTLDEDTLQEMKKDIPFESDREKIMKMEPTTILMYLREVAKHLIEIHENEDNDESPPNHYEVEIQKLEAEVRQHIRMEQQMKIFVEKNQERIEEFEKFGTGTDKNQKILKDLTQESDNIKYELEKKDKEIERLQTELKQKANILFLQEEEMRGFHKKNKIPLKEQDVSNNKISKDRLEASEIFQKKDGKENMNNHKRSTSTLNGGQNSSYLNTKNDQSLLSKQFETKQNSKILENNNKSKYTENNEEPKTLYSTFTGSTNFAKELKNSPLKKTHYNIGEINSKYVAKEKNAVNFSNIENNNNRSQSVEPQSKLYHFAKDFSKGKETKERNEDKSGEIRNKSTIGTSFDLAKNGSSSNLTKNRDSSRLRGQKIGN